MVLDFLAKKGFHPGNRRNQKRIFEAEQRHKHRAHEKQQRQRQLALEADKRHNHALAQGRAAAAHNPIHSEIAFMYSAPPGLAETREKQERAQRDEERFPILRGAPTSGQYTGGIDVTHKPFGVELRKVRCISCNQWGHQSGDRECPMYGHASRADHVRKDALDPVSKFLSASSEEEILKWELRCIPGSGTVGGFSSSDANQQFLPMDTYDLGGSGEGNAAEDEESKAEKPHKRKKNHKKRRGDESRRKRACQVSSV